MRVREVPQGARHLRTYGEFASYLTDFVQRRYPFLWGVGRPGLGKTEHIKAAVRGHNVYYRRGGQLTPLQLYIDLYHHRGQPVILDDAEHLLENKIGAKLITALGDTSPAKLLCYGTTGRGLGDVPQSYYTTSPLCILANRTTRHEHLQSRAVILYFDPTSLEVHRDVARWFWDQEVHDWFGQHLYRLRPLDTRWYVIADRDKRAGRDWRQIILKTHALNQVYCLVQDLEGDPAHPTPKDKARRFTESMGNARGASRASYYRLRQHLEQRGELVPQTVTQIPLRRTRPPSEPSLLELESMEAGQAPEPEEEPQVLDVPARGEFAQPITGTTAPQTPAEPMVLDDSLPWERPAGADEEGEE